MFLTLAIQTGQMIDSLKEKTQQGNGEAGQLFRSVEEINFLRIGLIVAGAWLVIALLERLIPWMANKLPSRLRLWLLPMMPVMRLGIMIVALTRIAPLVVETNQQNLLALAGAGALAIGFAFKDYVSSIIAGIVSLYERPFRAGDWVKINDAYGEVTFVGLRALKLVTPDDTVVTIPNNSIWTGSVFNANDGGASLMCVADFYLDPGHDGSLASRVLRDVALTSPYLDLSRPVAVVASEKPWATHYRVKAYPIDGRDQFLFITDLTLRGKAALLERGIQTAQAASAVLPG